MTEQKNSYTIKLTPEQLAAAAELLATGNYRPRQVPYAVAAAEGDDCQIVLYQSGKCLVQGKGAADWVLFTLEPLVLGEARLGYEEVLNPESITPHMGVDESGKGDFFGPLVIAAAYVDPVIAKDLKAMNVRDSKTITSDKAAHIDMVLNGKEKTAMAAFGALLSDVDIAAVVTFERNHWDNKTGDVVQPADIAARRK